MSDIAIPEFEPSFVAGSLVPNGTLRDQPATVMLDGYDNHQSIKLVAWLLLAVLDPFAHSSSPYTAVLMP